MTTTTPKEIDHMATIVIGSDRQEWPDTDPRVMAYRALLSAAERIGLATGDAQLRAHLKARRRRHTFRFTPPEALNLLVHTAPRVLSGDVTPEQAMGLLWTHDVQIARFGRRLD